MTTREEKNKEIQKKLENEEKSKQRRKKNCFGHYHNLLCFFNFYIIYTLCCN